jgi:Transglycosylase-like domain
VRQLADDPIESRYPMKIIVVSATAISLALPAVAVAKPQPPSRHDAKAYIKAYHAVAARFGHRAPGRDIIRDGLASGRPVTHAVVVRSISVLRRMLSGMPAPTSAPITHPQPIYYGGGYSIPGYIVQCESGGSWTAVNPSSGAGGAYQILPSSWAAYGGTGLPENATPAQQSLIAARIYASVGASAWVCG